MAVSDDGGAELADLPPAWVPAMFAVALPVVVGLLTGSLDSVMDKEASLGLQSGTRARKKMNRSRASYFKGCNMPPPLGRTGESSAVDARGPNKMSRSNERRFIYHLFLANALC